MSKQDYIMQGRNEGIAFCDKIVKEKALEQILNQYDRGQRVIKIK